MGPVAFVAVQTAASHFGRQLDQACREHPHRRDTKVQLARAALFLGEVDTCCARDPWEAPSAVSRFEVVAPTLGASFSVGGPSKTKAHLFFFGSRSSPPSVFSRQCERWHIEGGTLCVDGVVMFGSSCAVGGQRGWPDCVSYVIHLYIDLRDVKV